MIDRAVRISELDLCNSFRRFLHTRDTLSRASKRTKAPSEILYERGFFILPGNPYYHPCHLSISSIFRSRSIHDSPFLAPDLMHLHIHTHPKFLTSPLNPRAAPERP